MMDPFVFLKDAFPQQSENMLRDIICMVEESSPFDSMEQKIENMVNLLSGDEINEGNNQFYNENIEGAVGYGQNDSILNSYVAQLQHVFPNASPSFLREFCYNNRGDFDLGEAIERLSTEGYEIKALDLSSVREMLKEALPEADPSYLEEQSHKLVLQHPEQIQNFIATLMKNNDYPTKQEYLKHKKEDDELNLYRGEALDIDKFLQSFPDPEGTFEDPCFPNPLKDENVDEDGILFGKRFLYNKYPFVRKNHIDLVFKLKDMNLINCCDMLNTIKRGLKTKRPEQELPDIRNLALLQQIAYLKHRRLIKMCVKYKDDTYREIKEEARKLNLLGMCGICYQDELIPEECFTCQKGCIFCQDCVKEHVKVRMGEGDVKFRCCNECDSEFSIYTLQMALDTHTFQHLLLKIQSEELKQANVNGLETCPFCDYAGIPPESSKIFKCENQDCLKESCRLCRHESHIPLRCNEIEYDEDVKRRTYIENKMTEALTRTCYKCQKKFIKTNGCNKMICTCGAMMCYLCRQPINNYSHFGATCQLFTDDNQINLNSVKSSAEKAKQELGNVEIKYDPSENIERFFV